MQKQSLSVVAMVSVCVMWVTDRVPTGGLEVVGEMKKQGVPFIKDTFMLVFAICYKLVKAIKNQLLYLF